MFCKQGQLDKKVLRCWSQGDFKLIIPGDKEFYTYEWELIGSQIARKGFAFILDTSLTLNGRTKICVCFFLGARDIDEPCRTFETM